MYVKIYILLTFLREVFVSKCILRKLLLRDHFARMLKCDQNVKCAYDTTLSWIIESSRAVWRTYRKNAYPKCELPISSF